MAVELAIVSFVCAALLAVFIPVRRVRTSIPHLAIVLWLVGCNLIHGVNALLWDGNVNIHIPVWCDIVTKFLLGANIALPGALLSIALRLELVSSSRTLFTDKKVTRNRTILELVLCYVVPLLYMSLHLVVQDRRFDLVRYYGCSASAHPSTPAFLLIWIPPLAMCIIAFIFSIICIHNIGRIRGIHSHLEPRTTMSYSLFLRRLITCILMSGSLILIGLVSLFSVHSFDSWTSWSAVHASMAKIEVVQSQTDVKNVQFAWWSSFTMSVIYILLSFIIGEEARDSYRWIVEQATKQREFPRLELPIHHFKKHRPPQPMMSHARPSAKPQVRPLTIELKSGWDDVLDEKKFKWKGSRRNSKSLSPSVCSSPTPSHHSITEEDQQFMASTISYLVSPTAKTLGIEPPLQVPQAAMSPPRRALEIPPRPTSPPPIPKPKSVLKAPKNVPVDVDAIGSVLDAPWPVPPESPTPSLSRSYHSNRSPSHSRSHSPASSAEETFGYPLRPTLTPPHLRTRPFEGSSISSFIVETTPSPPSPSIKKVPVKRTSIRSLRQTWSKERIGQAYAASEVIHMTVVQETV